MEAHMTELTNMLNSTRSAEKGILAETLRFISSNVIKREVRRTRHLRDWFRSPMTYTRIIETPLTLILLNPCKTDRILDVSSPKLLALYLGQRDFPNVVAADMDDYFVADFNVYRNRCGIQIDTSIFDATKNIPFPDDHFDKIFSISVLEHIPGPGELGNQGNGPRSTTGRIACYHPASVPELYRRMDLREEILLAICYRPGRTFFLPEAL